MFSFLSNDLSFWSRSGPFPNTISAEMFNKGFSNPIFEKICRYFNRFGYFNYKNNLAHLMQARFVTVINMVNQLVDLRNKIAHGNPQATKTPSEVKEMMGIIRSFCSATDVLFSSWCKTQFCSIK